jgi:hypothetical protein
MLVKLAPTNETLYLQLNGKEDHSRLPQRFRNTSFDPLDLCSSKTSVITLVFRTAKPRTNWALEA